MFRGEQHRSNYFRVRVVGQGLALLLACVFFLLGGVGPAHAVSAGCQAARNGALNLAAVANADDTFGDNLAFDAGDTLTFTTTGNPILTQILINGATIPPTGSSTQFVFATTGTFAVNLTINSQVAIPSTMTVSCTGTTGEKQAALKTLTDALRTVDLNQQRTMLQEVQDSFLQGATVALFMSQLEARLAELREREAFIARQRAFLVDVQERRGQTIVDLIAQRTKTLKDIQWLKPLIVSQTAETGRVGRAFATSAYQDEIELLREEIGPSSSLMTERAKWVEEQRPYKEWLDRQPKGNLKNLKATGAAKGIARAARAFNRSQFRKYQKEIDKIDAKVAFNKGVIAKFTAALRKVGTGGTPGAESVQNRSRIIELRNQVVKHDAETRERLKLMAELQGADPLALDKNMSRKDAARVGRLAKTGAAPGASITIKVARALLKAEQDAQERKIAPVREEWNRTTHYERRITGIIKGYNAEVGQANAVLNESQTKLAIAESTVTSLNRQIAKTEGLIASTDAGLNRYSAQRQEVQQEIAEIESQLGALQTRMGVPPTQFTGANLHGALGLTQEAGPNARALNPLGLKGEAGGMSFFADLNTLRRQAHDQARLQQAGGATGPQVLTEQGSANILNPAVNVWVRGNYSDFDTDKAGADRDGDSYSVATGAYYAPTPRFMIGTMYRYRKSNSESIAQSSDVDAEGHGIGVNSTIVLTPLLSLSGHALFERSETDKRNGNTTGTFDTDQITVSGTLQGSIWRGPLWIRPAVGLTYSHSDQESYRDSVGALIPGQTSENAQVTFGPTIGFRKWREHGAIKFIEPTFSATGVWTFSHEGDTTLSSGVIIEQDDLAAQFSAGLSILLRNDMQLSVNGSYSGLGDSEQETWSVGGQISIPWGR